MNKIKEIQIYKKLDDVKFATFLGITVETLVEIKNSNVDISAKVAVVLENDGISVSYLMNGLVKNSVDRNIENNYLEYERLNNWDNKAELFTTLIKNYNGNDKPKYNDFFKLFKQYNKTENYTLENFEFFDFVNFCRFRYDFFIYCVDALKLKDFNYTSDFKIYKEYTKEQLAIYRSYNKDTNKYSFFDLVADFIFFGKPHSYNYKKIVIKDKFDIRFLNLFDVKTYGNQMLHAIRYGITSWDDKVILKVLDAGFKLKTIDPEQEQYESGTIDMVDDIVLTKLLYNMCKKNNLS